MLEFHLGEFLGNLDDRFAPEDGGSKHVRLVHGEQALVAAHRGGEGDPGDALDLALLVDHRVERDRLAVLLVAAFRRAEIDAAGEFADAEDIEAVLDEFLFHRRCIRQRGQADAGAEICEQPEVLPQRKQGTALRLDVRGQALPFRAADGAEQNRIRRLAGFHRRLRQRVAAVVDGRAADKVLGALDLEIEFPLHRIQHAQRLDHHFRADAVAG